MTSKPLHIEQWLAQLGAPAADRDYKPGHERMLALLNHLHEQRKPPLRIRIAGTNGKGSTGWMLAAALQALGLKVGLYSSPHIEQFHERIRINGVPVTDQALEQSLSRLVPAALNIQASYFEVATALALEQFSQHHVDVEILEAGVGARLDATTAVAADVALITPIGIDHQAWLGESLEEIAHEKAYIMQGCSSTLTAPQAPAVMKILKASHPALIETENHHTWQQLQMIGQHQQTNANLAYRTVKEILTRKKLITKQHQESLQAAKEAISNCQVPGRLQRIKIGRATVWLDAAHNDHAIQALLPTLKKLANPWDSIMIFTREDRSLKASLPLLAPLCKQLIYNENSPQQALQTALNNKPSGTFLLLGSFQTVAAINSGVSRLWCRIDQFKA